MEFNFYMPVKVIGGKDAVINNYEIFSQFGNRCLIITGKNSARKSGALSDVENALKKAGVSYALYDNIGENPLLSKCYEAGQLANKENAQFIIGIGGGSPLDASKAAAIFAANPDCTEMDIYSRKPAISHLPLILIGTTAGTGSEVSPVAVLTVDSIGMKKSISGPDCYAAVSFADSKYTNSVSYSTTVSTALDALSHITEGWFSPKITANEKLFAEKGIPMLMEGICFLYNNKSLPDEKIREKLYYGSLYAGVVLNKCGTAFPHPLGYVLTEKFHIPHGKACTVFMPYFIRRAKRYEPELFDKFIHLTGQDENTFIKIINELTDIKDLKFSKKEAVEIAERWNTCPKNFENSPGGFSKSDAVDVFSSLNR